MKTVAAALLVVVAAAVAVADSRFPIPIARLPPQIGKDADKTLLVNQRDFLRLLTHLNQPLLWKDLAEIAKDYKINPENYVDPQVAEVYLELEQSNETLPHGQPVSVFDEQHLEYIKIFLDLLYYSKNYDVFFKTALYLRDRVNKDLFLHAFYVAATFHKDTNELVLPPLYNVNPQLFFTSDAVEQVIDYKLRATGLGFRPYMLLSTEVNYTGYPDARTPEQRLSYFTEDIEFNEFVAQFFYHYPYFLKGENYSIVHEEVRGNVFYHTLKQLYGRYVLERLSNGLPEPELLDYEAPVKAGYYPQLRMQNGIEYGTRPANVHLRDVDLSTLERIRDAEYRIKEVVEMGYVISEKEGRQKYKFNEGTDIIGKLIQSTADSINPLYYGSFFRDLLSIFAKSSDITKRYGIASSVLGNYETMARDPVFFQIVRKVLKIFEDYKNNLPPYTKEELAFPGVQIVDADVDQLVTYFIEYYSDADNLVVENEEFAENTTFLIKQERLNHKPFTYKIKVVSEKPVRAIFRIFFGPRLDAFGNDIPLNVARRHFVEYDRFIYNVSKGEQSISRSSRQSPVYRHDSVSRAALLEAVNDALQGGKPFKPFGLRGYGFPDRLALPKGSRAGLPLRLYVIATPLDEKAPAASAAEDAQLFAEYGGAFTEWFVANADFEHVGFPFDRRIPHLYKFLVPNAHLKDVVVYHKTFDEINKTTQ